MKTHDPFQAVSETELTEMLRANEGPPEPLTAPIRRSFRQPSRRLLVGGAVALVVLASVLAAILQGGDRPSNENSACAALLNYGGVQYVGNSLSGLAVERESALGTAVVLGCADSVVVNKDTGETTVSGSADQQVEVFSLRGIEPSIAVVREGQPGVIYVAAGRCVGYGSDSGFLDCLRRPLRFQGRNFVATKLVGPTAVKQLITTNTIGEGVQGSERVEVVSLQGIPPAKAIARAGDSSAIYITDGSCYELTSEGLLRCLSGR